MARVLTPPKRKTNIKKKSGEVDFYDVLLTNELRRKNAVARKNRDMKPIARLGVDRSLGGEDAKNFKSKMNRDAARRAKKRK